MNISSGFRAPNTSELLSDGVHGGTNRYERGKRNLENENAVQIDFSVDYKNEHWSFSVNPFYNTIQNYIFLTPTTLIIDNNPVFDYAQTNAFLYGGEMGFRYQPHKTHWLHLENTVSTVLAEDKNGNALPLIPQTKFNSTISAAISKKGKLQLKNIFLQHIYKFRQNRIGLFETETAPYNVLNTGFSVEINTNKSPIAVNMGIKNLLNSRYIDHLSRFKKLKINNQGINFYLEMKMKLSK